MLEVIEDRLNFSPDTFAETFTKLNLRKNIDPIFSSIINCLSNVKAKIETFMVAPSENHHYFPSLMLSFGYFQIFVFLEQSLRVNQERFMT